jgi:hypothetical protein
MTDRNFNFAANTHKILKFTCTGLQPVQKYVSSSTSANKKRILLL